MKQLILLLGLSLMMVNCSGDDEELEDLENTNLGNAGNTLDDFDDFAEGDGALGGAVDAIANAANTAAEAAPPPQTGPTYPAGTRVLYVNASALHVRGGPARMYPVTRVLRFGDSVPMLGKFGRWIKISENEFASGKFLTGAYTGYGRGGYATYPGNAGGTYPNGVIPAGPANGIPGGAIPPAGTSNIIEEVPPQATNPGVYNNFNSFNNNGNFNNDFAHTGPGSNYPVVRRRSQAVVNTTNSQRQYGGWAVQDVEPTTAETLFH